MKEDLWLPLRFSENKFDCIPIVVDDTNLVPFQFRTLNTSSGTVTAFIVDSEDVETPLTITIHIYTIGIYTYYTFSDTVFPLSAGTYYLKLIDGSYTYYSVPFTVCALEPMAATGSKKWDMWLPLKFMSAPFNYLPIHVDCTHLIPFQFRTKNTSTGTVTASLISNSGIESSLTMDIKIYQIGSWTYYLFNDTVDPIPVGIYYLKLVDGIYTYYSVPFEVCCYETVSGIKFGFLYSFPAGGGNPYGALYNWYAVDDARNICSEGWHIPTHLERDTLITYLGGGAVAGGKLKGTGFTHWASPNTGATNEVGFNYYGGGHRSPSNGLFGQIRYISYLGCSDLYDPINYYIFYLSFNSASATATWGQGLSSGFSLRPIKDSTLLTDGQTGTYTDPSGIIYPTICIGTQEWVACNISTKHYRNGDAIPNVTDNATWAGLTSGAMCYYNNETRKEIANIGWHIPTRAEFLAIAQHLDPAYLDPVANVAGKEMKYSSTTYWNAPNTGTNSSGFGGRGAGIRDENGLFLHFKEVANYWTQESTLAGSAYTGALQHDEDWFYQNSPVAGHHRGCSVIVINDSTSLPEGGSGTYTGNDGHVYPTRVIGGMEVTIEPLIETKWRDGTDIPNITDAALWAADTAGARCSPENDIDNAFV